MSRIFNRYILFTLCLAACLAVPAYAQDRQAIDPAPLAPETEPNDTFDTATQIHTRTLVHGRINPAGDVDVYSFYPEPDLTLTVDVARPPSSPIAPVAAVYDAEHILVAQSSCTANPCLTANLGTNSPYYIVVQDENGAGGNALEYSLWLDFVDPDEPNDFLSQAVPYTVGERVNSVFSVPGDVDMYSVYLVGGREYYLEQYFGQLDVLDQDGEFLYLLFGHWGAVFTVEESGNYFFRMFTEDDSWTPYTLQVLEVNRPTYVSFQAMGTIGGVMYKPGDILRYNPLFDTWQMHFQAADVGLRGNLTAFDIDSWGRIYLSVSANQNLAGAGRVTPQDVLVFDALSTGPDTTGIFQLWMDGSDMGLTTAGESIDALADEYYQSLYISTKGGAKIPSDYAPLVFQKNDVAQLYLGMTGPDTTGSSILYADGLALGLGAANIVGLDTGRSEELYLLLDRPVTLAGIPFMPGDIAHCWLNYEHTACDVAQKAFDAAAVGLGTRKIDAISIGDVELH